MRIYIYIYMYVCMDVCVYIDLYIICIKYLSADICAYTPLYYYGWAWQWISSSTYRGDLPRGSARISLAFEPHWMATEYHRHVKHKPPIAEHRPTLLIFPKGHHLVLLGAPLQRSNAAHPKSKDFPRTWWWFLCSLCSRGYLSSSPPWCLDEATA